MVPMTLDQQPLKRAYEMEEFMGRVFIEEIANQHDRHLKVLEKERQRNFISWQASSDQQKDLPAYVWGARIAKLCKQLEEINTDRLTGSGRIVIKNNRIQGEYDTNTFYEKEKAEYYSILGEFSKGWHYYLSVLETGIVKEKLKHILESFTFKYTRMH